MVKNTKFDRFFYSFVRLLGRKGFSLQPTQSRWGFTAVFSTVFLALIAIAIALYAVYEASGKCGVMLGFIIAIGFIGILGVLFIACLGLFFVRNPNTEDPIVTEVRTMRNDFTKELKTINKNIKKHRDTKKT